MYGLAANHHALDAGGLSPLVRGGGTPLSGGVSRSQFANNRWRRQRSPCRLVAALDPAFPNQQTDLPEFQWPWTSRVGRGPLHGETAESRDEAKDGAKEQWPKHNKSALTGESPLPLPLGYAGAAPATKKHADAMSTSNPEKEEGKQPVYEWTAKCTRCQGTGEVSFYRKRGNEVISTCIACTGIGFVHKITTRPPPVDGSDRKN